MKPQTSVDVEVLLSEVVGGAKKLTSLVDIYKEKDKPTALVKPKRRIPRAIWSQIHEKIKEWGGRWSRQNQFWEVSLNERRELT